MSRTSDLAQPLGASEVAQALAVLAADHHALPDDAAEQLCDLLGHSLAAASAAHRRDARLGLLFEIVGRETGEVPTEDEYEAERAVRRARGEEWPTAQTLGRAYGHWLTAVRAAMRFWFDGGHARVASGHEHATGTRPGYQPEEIVRAVARFFFVFGVWPTQWEYVEWRKLQVDAWRRAGQADRRLPNMKQIRKAFGDFDRAVALAETWASGRPLQASREAA